MRCIKIGDLMTEPKNKGPNPIDVHVGSRVRLKRSMLGLSQEKLADQLGITFQQVQKYEKGTNRISASRMFEISRILQVPVDFLFEGLSTVSGSATGMAEEGSSDYVVDFLSTAEGVQLNRSFVKIKDPLVRKKIIDLVRSLSDDG